jgi:16S rRNA (guanine527-N7)-methyltransferase
VSTTFDQAVRVRATEAGISLTDQHLTQLRAYYELLARWNRTINLTSLRLEAYPSETIDRLLIEPLLAAGLFPRQPPRWLDLGTGSGSPAVPLRIIEPRGSLEMIESRERKTAFLREAVRVLDLERTEVRTARIEDFATSSTPSTADLITMRAVKPTLPILHAAAHVLKSGGRFLVFGSTASGDLERPVVIRDAGFQAETAPLLEPEYRLFILTRR